MTTSHPLGRLSSKGGMLLASVGCGDAEAAHAGGREAGSGGSPPRHVPERKGKTAQKRAWEVTAALRPAAPDPGVRLRMSGWNVSVHKSNDLQPRKGTQCSDAYVDEP